MSARVSSELQFANAQTEISLGEKFDLFNETQLREVKQCLKDVMKIQKGAHSVNFDGSANLLVESIDQSVVDTCCETVMKHGYRRSKSNEFDEAKNAMSVVNIEVNRLINPDYYDGIISLMKVNPTTQIRTKGAIWVHRDYAEAFLDGLVRTTIQPDTSIGVQEGSDVNSLIMIYIVLFFFMSLIYRYGKSAGKLQYATELDKLISVQQAGMPAKYGSTTHQSFQVCDLEKCDVSSAK